MFPFYTPDVFVGYRKGTLAWNGLSIVDFLIISWAFSTNGVCFSSSRISEIGALENFWWFSSALWRTSKSSILGFIIPAPFRWYHFHAFISDCCMRSEVNFEVCKNVCVHELFFLCVDVQTCHFSIFYPSSLRLSIHIHLQLSLFFSIPHKP